MAEVAQAGRQRHQALEVVAAGREQRLGLVERERLAGLGAREGRGGAGAAVPSGMRASLLRCTAMKVVALAGGIGAGKFLRGLVRVVRRATTSP